MKKISKLVACIMFFVIISSSFTSTAKATDYTASMDIVTYTSPYGGAGTDANVQIRIVGENGKCVYYTLDNDSNNFEYGAEDTFHIDNVRNDLGLIYSIAILRDNAGSYPDWNLAAVSVSYTDDSGSHFFARNFSQWIPANQWIMGKDF